MCWMADDAIGFDFLAGSGKAGWNFRMAMANVDAWFGHPDSLGKERDEQRSNLVPFAVTR
ncbi:hypothetical protein N7510_010985 [Penicillium lagena]|uniref:uncharacterized protein n=1 Tax=Penicillium lagena TaxID=94218 RepID=UPI0025412D9B|nr:uncharacterized protein N7510_010985 [Penicillium lagena]KAJ5601451.1 hypothetical protein N7510_010985 [Penicillium lagena]